MDCIVCMYACEVAEDHAEEDSEVWLGECGGYLYVCSVLYCIVCM